MQCLPDSLLGRTYYRPTQQGSEARAAQRLEQIQAWKRAHSPPPKSPTKILKFPQEILYSIFVQRTLTFIDILSFPQYNRPMGACSARQPFGAGLWGAPCLCGFEKRQGRRPARGLAAGRLSGNIFRKVS